MGHTIARSKPSIQRDTAGPLSLDNTSRREWDIVMTRDDRWVTCRTGVTDREELLRELEWFRLGNPSGSVTFHVLERVITMRERIVGADDVTVEDYRQETP